MRIVLFCLWAGLVGTAMFMSKASPAQTVSSEPKTESVMSPGMKITVKAPAGIMTITARDNLVRAYTWEGATRSVEMIPRGERWYGSLGLYFPGPGDHWKEHNGITRGVLEEGQQHFKTTAEALKWLHASQLIYRDDGLAAAWSKQLERGQLSVAVWQIYVAGKKPAKLSGSQNGKIAVTYGPSETSPLVRAVVRRDVKTVQVLLNNGADPNTKDSVATPILLGAARRGDLAIVQALLDKGAKTDVRDADGATALLKAVEGDHSEVVRALLAKGAKTEPAYERGMTAGVTPLMLAVLNDKEEMVRTLLDGGANVQAVDATGKTPLSWAASATESVSIAKMLVNKGAEVDSRDWVGMTPLMEAAMQGKVDIVKFLIDNKANVNARIDATRKRYSNAQFEGDIATVKEIEKSGKLNTLHEDGISVLKWASISHNEQIIALLKAAGAKE